MILQSALQIKGPMCRRDVDRGDVVGIYVYLTEGGQGLVGYSWVANKQSEVWKFKFISRELELSNLLGLVLGCIEAKFCK